MSSQSVGNDLPEQLDLTLIGIGELDQGIDPLALDQLQRRTTQPHHAGLADQV
jgi:hypothetical protein